MNKVVTYTAFHQVSDPISKRFTIHNTVHIEHSRNALCNFYLSILSYEEDLRKLLPFTNSNTHR